MGKRKSRETAAAPRRHKRATQSHVPLPAPVDGSDDDVSEEDLEFVERLSAPGLAFLAKLDQQELDKALQPKSKKKVPANLPQPASHKGVEGNEEDDAEEDPSDTEEAYERTARLQAARDAEDEERVVLLPTKTMDGQLVYEKRASATRPKLVKALQVEGITIQDDAGDAEVEGTSDEEPASGDDGAESDAEAPPVSRKEEKRRKRAERAGKSASVALGAAGRLGVTGELQEYQSAAERREELKQHMAVACGQLLAAPEEHVRNLRALLALTADDDLRVRRLAQLSLLAVLRDIMPGYRIRLPSEKELSMPVSKDVRKVRDYESTLLRLYQAYVKQIVGAASSPKNSEAPCTAAQRVAVSCLCGLLTALPHFNYTSDVLQAVVANMISRDVQVATMACDAVREVLNGDISGELALEAVQLVADLIRTRKCNCPPQVLEVMYVLQLDEAIMSDRKEKERGVGGGRIRKKKGKKADEVDAAFKEADAAPDADQRREMQSLTLEALFEAIFRVLKHATASGAVMTNALTMSRDRVAHKFPLLDAALRGTAQYAHLISVDFFGDLMAELLRLLRAPGLPLPIRLQVLLAASDILRGQGEALNIDRRDFYNELYSALQEAPYQPLLEGTADVPYSAAASQRAAKLITSSSSSAGQSPAEASETASVRLLRLADQMLCGTKMVDGNRLAAFAKRLTALALAEASGEALGCLALVNRLVRRHSKLRSMLEFERSGSSGAFAGGFRLDAEDPAEASAAGEPLWELALAARHYHPHVATAAQSIAAIPPDGGGGAGSAIFAMGLTPAELALSYSTCSGGYKPPPQLPRKHAPSHSKRLQDGSLCGYFANTAGISDDDWRQDETSSSSQDDAEGLGTELKALYREARDFRQHAVLRRQAKHYERLLARIRRAQQAAAKAKGPISNGKVLKAGVEKKKTKKQRA